LVSLVACVSDEKAKIGHFFWPKPLRFTYVNFGGNMGSQLAPVIEDEVGLGDHVAFFFKDNAERLAFVIPYMVRGLQNLERCVYIAHENKLTDISAEFKDAGVDIDAASASGALSILTTHDTYLRHGIFEPERMIADLDRDVRFALQLGFSGLRVTGEMSWALDLPFALSRLCEYEQELCRRWPVQLGGLCQYNESFFSADVVEKMAGCHSVVVRDGNIIRQHIRTAELT
jgi:two-component system, chemotaxis family, sensor kinase Cph1